MPSPSEPPYSLGQVMPSQPRSPMEAMKARRLGVSTIWAMFSLVTSKTSGSSLASRKVSTSFTKASCSGENSKSMVPLSKCETLNLTTRQFSLDIIGHAPTAPSGAVSSPMRQDTGKASSRARRQQGERAPDGRGGL